MEPLKMRRATMKCPECNGTGKQKEPQYRCEDCDGTGKQLCEECFEELEFCECNQNNEPEEDEENE
jgi:DnaJ-class molecular chaperone